MRSEFTEERLRLTLLAIRGGSQGLHMFSLKSLEFDRVSHEKSEIMEFGVSGSSKIDRALGYCMYSKIGVR